MSLGCLHDDVRAEPGSWLVVGMIPVFDKQKAMQTGNQTDTGATGAPRRRVSLHHQCFGALPQDSKQWWPSTAEIGTKLLYLPSPEPVVYVVPLSHILGKLPLVPAGDSGTIPWSMNGRKETCFPRGQCDRQQGPGSKLFYINTWAMIWPTDYAARK